MTKHGLSLTLAVSIALLGAATARGATYSTPSSAKKIGDTPKPNLKVMPEGVTVAPSAEKQLFPVKDEKGLLLTCVAPEINKNANTDLFNNCSLAPGRTLDDVMHAFISAIHYEQAQRVKERAEWEKELEEKSGQKAASK